MSTLCPEKLTASFDVASDRDEDLIGDLFWTPAEEMWGSKLDDQQLLLTVSEVFAGQPVCVVRHWMVIDVTFVGRHDQLIRHHELQPTVLYANSAFGVGGVGDLPTMVLSGFARRYEDCFFETEDMLYVLAGRGFRKRASVLAVAALARQCGKTSGLT